MARRLHWNEGWKGTAKGRVDDEVEVREQGR